MTKRNEELIKVIEDMLTVDYGVVRSPRINEITGEVIPFHNCRVDVSMDYRDFSGMAKAEANYTSSKEFQASEAYYKLLIRAVKDLIETLENQANELYALLDGYGALEDSE